MKSKQEIFTTDSVSVMNNHRTKKITDVSTTPYVETILKKSEKKLTTIFGDDYEKFCKYVRSHNKSNDSTKSIEKFLEIYYIKIKEQYQKQEYTYDKKLLKFLQTDNDKIKIVWGDSLNFLKKMPNESVQLMVTSPPYYNARDYAQWDNLTQYLAEMETIIKESYRVLDNNHVFVFNVGDIFDNDNLKAKATWGKRRLPLGAYFINIFERCGFTFVDDFMWDKGEVQSQRHKNGSRPFPFYQYPVNCYEHIFVFHKHRLDNTPYPCPICGCLNVNGNSQSEINLMSWECKNHDCFVRSECDRGKRFSSKTNMVQDEKRRTKNEIDHDLIKKWRRDIIHLNPVFKINNKGKNILGHTAPFPKDIPEMAVNFFSYAGDLVLDPFAGSFTSPIVAQQLGRIGIGVERRKDLFQKPIIKNIKNHNIKYDTIQV